MLDHFTISCLLAETHICSFKILRLHEKIFYGKHLLRAHRAYNGWKDEEGERGGAEVSIKQAERSPADDVLMIRSLGEPHSQKSNNKSVLWPTKLY